MLGMGSQLFGLSMTYGIFANKIEMLFEDVTRFMDEYTNYESDVK